MNDVVICSFYTAEEYYAAAADRLRRDLTALDIPYVLKAMDKRPGEDWADICRKKVPFIDEVCRQHPRSRVIWVDVDCRLLDLPDFVRESTADIVGFVRGFGSPLRMGYAHRTRFWEPCFWGIGPSETARQMISNAAELERRSEVKATDDYFFEEAWRVNAERLSFQIIPSGCVAGKGEASVESFLVFGSSGEVNSYKTVVAQHQRQSNRASLRTRAYTGVKQTILRAPDPLINRAISIGQRTGVTEWLKRDDGDPGLAARRRTMSMILQAGIRGEGDAVEALHSRLESALLLPTERATVEAARSFVEYAPSNGSETVIPLKWWARPFPGNFGDWLSPYLVTAASDGATQYVSPNSTSTDTHLVAIGSIGRYVNKGSIVVGTGVSNAETSLDPRATYVSVRGPLTAKVLADAGGPQINSFGDPGILLSRFLPLSRGEGNGRMALVRHYAHASAPLRIPDNVDELSILGGSRTSVESMVQALIQYDGVITSAMHVLIVCHSYGIPCVLVSFEGFEDAVHGSGMKYSDYCLGVGLDEMKPEILDLDLRTTDLHSMLSEVRVEESVKDDVLRCLMAGIERAAQQ